MTAVVYTIVYLGILGFLIGSAIRAVRYARQPLHLRWELYPVPHEDPSRVGHGGSYFEEVDWWTKSSKTNLAMELKFMLPEMVFLKGLWEFNRSLWFRSFPFHFGLYLTITAVILLFGRAIVGLVVPTASASLAGLAVGVIYSICGAVGGGLTLLGAFGLLLRRLRDPKLRNYTAPGDIFNLAVFVIAMGLLFVGFGLRGADYPGTLRLAQGLLTFNTGIEIPGLISAGLIVSSLLIIYIPTTHMSHYVAKYFTYHSIRWDDVPVAKTTELQKKFAEYLAYRPDWSARHVGADGKRTWADIAGTNPHSLGGNAK